MHKFSAFLDKARGKQSTTQDLQSQQQPLQQQTSVPPASYADVQRYGYHHGTNIGTVFILERWLCGSMFPDGSEGSSELAAVQAWIEKEGLDAARARFENHWRDYVSDADLDRLRDVAKCNAIRLPIGYFTLGPPYCESTPFKDVSQIYQNAWLAVKLMVERCQQRGIATLIDLHGVPGGANAQEHSGTNSGKAEFWSNPSYRDLAIRCLAFIVQQVKTLPGVAGIQVVNEAEHSAANMYEWYGQVLAELSRIDSSMPVFISDGWDLGTAASWAQQQNKAAPAQVTNPIVIDTHLYWTFSEPDKKKSPQQIISEVPGSLANLDGKDGSVVDRGAITVIVGEYSCVLSEDSWAKSNGEDKKALVNKFGNTQSNTYQHRAGGSFFWTYRMDWMDGGEWGFRQMVNAGAITPPSSLLLSKSDLDSRLGDSRTQRQDRRSQTVGAHRNYWDNNHPGHYEHEKFELGWDIGYDDAKQFFSMRAEQGFPGADKIGMLDLWCLKRLRDSGQAGQFVWEFEQGLRQGIRDFYQVIRI